MSSLTSKCAKYYVPYYYTVNDTLITYGCENETEEGAIAEAENMIKYQVEKEGTYCYAVIKVVIKPLYGE